MLLSCILLLLSLTGARGQSNSEYNFVGYPYNSQLGVQDGYDYHGVYGEADMPILTMDCLAANGSGQWTLTTQTGIGSEYGVGWYLLENALRNPEIIGTPVPPGVVANGSFSSASRYSPLQPKVTANLDESVNYVFPSGDRKSFDIEYFGPSDIDISLHGIPNDGTAFPSGTQVVKASGLVTHSANITTYDGTYYHDITSESNYKDDFAVCSDGYYVYITWCSSVHTGGGKYVYFTYFDLATHTQSTIVVVGAGRKPTIACDVRKNRTGSPAVWYEIGYVTTAGGSIIWTYNHGGATGTYTTNNVYIDPSSGSTVSFSIADHVCALVSSVVGVIQYSALYAIVENSAGKHLVMYNPSNTNLTSGDAAYVDGNLLVPYSTTLLPTPSSGNGWPILDAPLVAFANPYDNQSSWHTYDQFHCLYQLDLSAASGQLTDEVAPLLIVRNADNGSSHPTSPDPGSHDTRLVINQTLSEPPPTPHPILMTDPNSGYTASVNQMGIHAHWRNGAAGSGTHYYFRDWNRTFDEGIDENTLVTDICFVTNGSSSGTNHGGTLGATLTKNYRMTIWTDPNYGFNSTDVTIGTYQANGNQCTGGLFLGNGSTAMNGMRLTVGEGTSTSAATFTMGTNSMFVEDDVSTGQGLTVTGNSLFDYYGLYYAMNNTGLPASEVLPFNRGAVGDAYGRTLGSDGGGDVFLDGTTSLSANMNVHGGASFHLAELSTFESSYGKIDIKYEPNIFPIHASGTANSDASGVMEFACPATFTHSTITAHFPSISAINFMIHVLKAPDAGLGGSNPFGQMTSSFTSYSNSNSNGLAVIRFDNNTPGGIVNYGASSFTDDNFSVVQITAIDPQTDFTVQTSTFGGTQLYAVDLESLSLSSYGSIQITNNTFNDGGTNALADVYVYQMNAESISSVDVESNTLYAGHHDTDYPFTGIFYNLSYGLIGFNSISGGFIRGIRDFGPYSSPWDGTLICSNPITDLTIGSTTYSPGQGILTSGYQGYVKLEDISHAGSGYTHMTNGGPPHLVFSKIYSNNYFGVVAAATLDLSGVHHPLGYGDLAGLNEIHDNGDYQIDITSSSTDLWLTRAPGSTWTVDGENNIYQGSSSSSVLIQGDANGNATLDIGNNWWGGTVDPSGAEAFPNSTYFPSYNYTTYGSNASQSSISGISCSGGLVAKPVGQIPQSIQSEDTGLCNQAINLALMWNSDAMNPDLAYDTMHYYILHCYQIANATQTFGALGGCWGSEMNTLQGRLNERAFLISALKLRSDNEWFCQDVGAMVSTYDAAPKRQDARVALAIIQFLINNPRCAADRTGNMYAYDGTRAGWYQGWLDTANVYYKGEVFDSTLPTMHQLGLDSVLMYASASVYYEASGPQIIGDAHVITNPFQDETSLSLAINREAYVHIEVFDPLGRKLEKAGFDGVFETGSRVVPLGLSSQPPGTY